MKKSKRLLLATPFLILLALIVFAPTPLLQASQTVAGTLAWPFLKVGAFIPEKIRDTMRFWRTHGALREENARLAKRASQAQDHDLVLAELRQENQRLRDLLDFTQEDAAETLAARVVGYDPSGWKQAILLDKGSGHGVHVHQAVISTQGVVGKVVAVTPTTAKVLLVVDHALRIGAMIEDSRHVGVLEGYGTRKCMVRYLPKDARIELGGRVVTSGLGGVFPKGLLLGKVIGSGWDEQELYQVVEVAPAVSFSQLEEVLLR